MKIISKLICLLLVISIVTFPSLAEDTEAPDLTPSNVAAGLRDNNAATYASLSEITLSAETEINSIYIVFRSEAIGFTVSSGDENVHFEGGYLQYFADLTGKFKSEAKTVKITLDKAVSVCDLYAFGEGELPSFVHNWQAPHEKADLLLFTSHADDEQLFFAGILPYYAGELGLRVQVAYFTDHFNGIGRRHELLNGLWTVGVRNYPHISAFPDEYSETYEGALSNLKKHGFTEDDVLAHQTMLLRRFKPLVAVGHDLEGEYGHGQHKLNSATLTKAIELAADETKYPATAKQYGTWETPKLYLHLYKENQIEMNWDVPLEAFGGKTAFQVTQDGFQCHKSQHYTWFNTWLNGSSGNITKASQITQHSPCQYGLYHTTVGADVAKNDFFENITTYAEQERIAAEEEAKRLEEEERKRKEEESRKAAEEESKRAEEEAKNTTAAQKEERKPIKISNELKFVLVIFAVAIAAMIVTVKVMNDRRRRRHRRRK